MGYQIFQDADHEQRVKLMSTRNFMQEIIYPENDHLRLLVDKTLEETSKQENMQIALANHRICSRSATFTNIVKALEHNEEFVNMTHDHTYS